MSSNFDTSPPTTPSSYLLSIPFSLKVNISPISSSAVEQSTPAAKGRLASKRDEIKSFLERSITSISRAGSLTRKKIVSDFACPPRSAGVTAQDSFARASDALLISSERRKRWAIVDIEHSFEAVIAEWTSFKADNDDNHSDSFLSPHAKTAVFRSASERRPSANCRPPPPPPPTYAVLPPSEVHDEHGRPAEAEEINHGVKHPPDMAESDLCGEPIFIEVDPDWDPSQGSATCFFLPSASNSVVNILQDVKTCADIHPPSGEVGESENQISPDWPSSFAEDDINPISDIACCDAGTDRERCYISSPGRSRSHQTQLQSFLEMEED